MRRRTLLKTGTAGLAALATVGAGAGTVAAQSNGTVSSPFQVTNRGLNYFVNGVDGPTLDLSRGRTYVFNVDTSGHPFHISTDPNGGSGFPGVYEQGVSVTQPDSNEDDATQTGTLTFTVPDEAPDQLYYQCGVHGNMGGEITVSDPDPVARTFQVTNQGLNYFLDGVERPPITLVRERTYAFEVSASGHPFHVSTDASGGDFTGIYTWGVTATQPSGHPNATESGTLTFTVPADAPDPLYYQCGVHGSMGGEIEVIDGPSRVGAGAPPIDTDGDGRYEDVNGNGRRDYDDVVSLFEGFDDEAVQSQPTAYDFNGNGRLDFADIVTLFEN